MHSAFCHKRQGPWNGVLARPRPLEGIAVTSGITELLRAWWKTTIIVIFVLALRHSEVTSEHLTKMFPAGRLSRGRLILRHGVIITCDNQTLVVCQSLCEEAGYNQLRIHEEQNLFLQQTSAEDTSTYPAGRKIHLPIVYINRNEKERKKQNKKCLKWLMETSLQGLSLLLMGSHLQQACAFILNGSMWGDVHPRHHLVTAVKGKQKKRKKLLHSVYRGYFLRTPWKCTMSLTMVQLQSHKIQITQNPSQLSTSCCLYDHVEICLVPKTEMTPEHGTCPETL